MRLAASLGVRLSFRLHERVFLVAIHMLRLFAVLFLFASIGMTVATLIQSFRIGIGAWADLQIFSLGSVSASSQAFLIRVPQEGANVVRFCCYSESFPISVLC